MVKDVATLIQHCKAFEKMHIIITGNMDGDRFFCMSRIYEMLYNLYPDTEIPRELMHQYLKDDYKKHSVSDTNYHIDRINERKHKPVTCKTLQKEGYCKKECSNIGNSKSPFVFLCRIKHRPHVQIEGEIKTILEFTVRYELTGSDIQVILCLLSYYNGKDDIVYPSLETIGKDANLADKTIIEAIKRLEKQNLIYKYKQYRQGQFPFNRYRLLTPLLKTFKPIVAKQVVAFSVTKEVVETTTQLKPYNNQYSQGEGVKTTEEIYQEDIDIGVKRI